jgi:hypothetical protein
VSLELHGARTPRCAAAPPRRTPARGAAARRSRLKVGEESPPTAFGAIERNSPLTVAGAEWVRRYRFETTTVEEALREAAAVLGREPRVLAVPELSKPAFHLTTGAGHTM